MTVIIKAGEKAPREWREKRNALKRGVVAKAKFDAANRDFMLYLEKGLQLEATAKTRASLMYAHYRGWATKNSDFVMSMRAFGFQVRKYFPVKKGPGGIVFYVGVEPKAEEAVSEGGV